MKKRQTFSEGRIKDKLRFVYAAEINYRNLRSVKTSSPVRCNDLNSRVE